MSVKGVREGAFFQTSIHNIGVETDFHVSNAFFPDPERLLSEWESKFARELKRWDFGPLDEQGMAIADRFVTHLRVRSKTMRAIGAQLASVAWAVHQKGIDDVVRSSQPQIAIREEIGSLLDEAARRGRENTWTESTQRCFVDEMAHGLLFRHTSNLLLGQAARMARTMFNDDFGSEVLSGTHTTLMLTMLLNHRRASGFGSRAWGIVEVNDESLLLGDIGPLCTFQIRGELKPLYATNAPVVDIVLPIAPNRLLVGRTSDLQPLPSVSQINRASIELSHEFVVGDWSEDRFLAVRDGFGKRKHEDTPQTIFGISVPNEPTAVHELADALSAFIGKCFAEYWTSQTPCQFNLPIYGSCKSLSEEAPSH